MELLIEMKEELKGYVGWPKIYQFDESETKVYDDIKTYLKEDSEFLDIILDGIDMADLLSKFEGKTDKFKRVNLRDYLYNKLLEKADVTIQYEDINLMPYDMETEELDSELKRIAKLRGKENFRIHIFLDETPEEALQSKINDLFTYKKMTVIGYRSKKLLSYIDSTNNRLEALYDYIPVSVGRCARNGHQRSRN